MLRGLIVIRFVCKMNRKCFVLHKRTSTFLVPVLRESLSKQQCRYYTIPSRNVTICTQQQPSQLNLTSSQNLFSALSSISYRQYCAPIEHDESKCDVSSSEKPKKTADTFKIAELDKKVPLSFKIGCYTLGIVTIVGSLVYLRENLLFGTMAGLTAKTVTAPLERITVYKQASIGSGSGPSGVRNPNASYVLRNILKTEGVFGLWRGNAINIGRASVQKGSLFALNDFFKKLYIRLNIFGKKNENSKILSFTSGVSAGLASTVWTYPMEIVKTVNQTTIHANKWPMITVWYYLAQTKGYIRGPWTAVLPTLVGTSIYYGIKFTVFDLFIIMGKEWNNNQMVGIEELTENLDVTEIDIDSDNIENVHESSFHSEDMNQKMAKTGTEEQEEEKTIKKNGGKGYLMSDGMMNALGGALAGVSGNCVTFPNNCIRKRMQTTHVMKAMTIKMDGKSGYDAGGWFHTLQNMKTYEGGYRRFYNGFGINLIRNAPNTAIQFYVYKQLQSYYYNHIQKPKENK